jgi:hypothetical protein
VSAQNGSRFSEENPAPTQRDKIPVRLDIESDQDLERFQTKEMPVRAGKTPQNRRSEPDRFVLAIAGHPLAGVPESPVRQIRPSRAFSRTCLQTGRPGRIFLAWLPQPFAISSAFAFKYTMTDEDERELETELARLQQEHRDLDAAIDALHQSPAPDLLRLQRLKKRKLQLRDRIAFIEDQITPDIIA